jgi:proline dehydrogenase
MEKLMRDFFLFLATNRMMTRFAKKYGSSFGASRFVAGETIDEAVQVIKELNGKGLAVTIDYLGEFVDNEKEANEMADQTIEAINAIGREKLNSQLSLKLTSMGLDISEKVVMENMRRILKEAEENQVFVTIDMENYSRCQKTLDIFKKLRTESENIGTVIQSYLYRSEQDIMELNNYSASLRLVKGAYKESSEVAYPNKADVDKNLKKIIEKHLQNGNYTAVASHDDAIIEHTKKYVKENNIPTSQFEFQMLYGIRPERQIELAEEGYTMRVYVPYGTDWYGYFMRRIAERPANASFILKGIFKK